MQQQQTKKKKILQFGENDKSFLKDFKEDLNKWGYWWNKQYHRDVNSPKQFPELMQLQSLDRAFNETCPAESTVDMEEQRATVTQDTP